MSNPCRVETLLSAFFDSELSETEAKQVKLHIEHCPHCRQKLTELSAVDGLVQGMETIEPSDGFDRTFWRKVANLEEKQNARWWRHLFQPGWRPVLATGLAAGLVVGVFFMTSRDKGISLEDRFVAENVEFLNDYELIHELEILQNWEALEAMKELS